MKRSDNRLKILLSEGSSTSARQTLYALGGRFDVDVVDPSRWCQCRFSRFVRRWYRVPPIANDPLGYLKFVAGLLRRERYDVFLPTHEQVYLIARYREALGRHVGLAVPEFRALKHLQSKADFVRLLEQLGLPTPPTRVVRSERELRLHASFPCFVKLAHSTASYGVKRVECAQELIEAIGQFKNDGLWEENAEIVIQQPAQGRQAVVNTVFQHGRLVAAHCTELLATGIGGGPSLRVSVSHPVVVEHARRLGGHLNWHGPLLLDYFYDFQTKQPQYIEANPRIGEVVNALLCGVNLCELVVRISLGQHVEAEPIGTTGVRSHTGFIVLLADAYNGASRRQIFDRLRRMWAGKDIFDCQNEMTRPREDWASLIPAAATTLRLLTFPRSARRLSKKTVDNYSLPQSAVSAIERLPADVLAE